MYTLYLIYAVQIIIFAILAYYLCYDLNRKRNGNWSEFETPPNATSRRVCLRVASHSINPKREALGPLSDPLMGLREGMGAMGEGWEGRREDIERWERV